MPVVVPAVSLGFRVDHEVPETVVKEPSPSSVHLQSPRVINALSEHASDRCRLRLVIGAVSVCLKRGTFPCFLEEFQKKSLRLVYAAFLTTRQRGCHLPPFDVFFKAVEALVGRCTVFICSFRMLKGKMVWG